MLNSEKKNSTGKEKKKEPFRSFFLKIVVIGFTGGVLWSLIGYFAYVLNFTKIGPNRALMLFAFDNWKNGVAGHFAGAAFIGIISILTAFLYYVLFKKVRSIWGGIVFGVALWAVVFCWLGPAFLKIDPLGRLGTNTIVTSICLYVLFGVFVGYSISYEYGERQS
ncbi:YqhR family membrane protein [Aeribacillus pallidus]|nr:YqhR family membrane protein [Aeribacillus pallidus]